MKFSCNRINFFVIIKELIQSREATQEKCRFKSNSIENLAQKIRFSYSKLKYDIFDNDVFIDVKVTITRVSNIKKYHECSST